MPLNDYEYDLSLGLPGETVAPGIGMGETQAPAPVETRTAIPPISRAQVQRDLRDEAWNQMSGMQKFGTALGEVGAGLQGRPSPLDARVRQQREERALEMNELRANIGLLHEAVSASEKLDGEPRINYINAMAGKLDEAQPGLGNALRTFSDNPDMLTRFKDVIPYLDDPLQQMAKSNPRGFIKMMGTAEGIKLYQDGYNRLQLKIASAKARPIVMGYQQIASPELVAKITKQGYMTASDFNAIQDALPEGHPAKLTERQRGAIQNKSDVFYQALNIMSPKEEAEVRKKQAEDKGKRETIEVGVGGDMFQKAYIVDGKVQEYVGKPYKKKEGVTVNMPGFAQLVTKDGVPGIMRIGKDGKQEFVPNVTPTPKDVDPFRQAMADELLRAGGRGGKPGKKINVIPPEGSAKNLPKSPGGKPVPTQADRDWVKTHPADRQKFINTFGVNP